MRAILPLLAAAALLVAAGDALARDRTFRTPSHNIGCLYATTGGVYLRCDVRSAGDAAWILSRRGRGRRVHATDTVYSPHARVLSYGHSLALGPFTCTSRRAGLTCRNRRNGHGFFLSRGRQRVF
jgi:uncharacterized protein DUF6636